MGLGGRLGLLEAQLRLLGARGGALHRTAALPCDGGCLPKEQHPAPYARGRDCCANCWALISASCWARWNCCWGRGLEQKAISSHCRPAGPRGRESWAWRSYSWTLRWASCCARSNACRDCSACWTQALPKCSCSCSPSMLICRPVLCLFTGGNAFPSRPGASNQVAPRLQTPNFGGGPAAGPGSSASPTAGPCAAPTAGPPLN